MSPMAYVQTELVPFVALIMILFCSWRDFRSVPNIRRYQLLLIMILCALAVDAFNWYTVAHPMQFALPVLCVSNAAYFLLSEATAYLWFLYVAHQIYDNQLSGSRKHWIALSAVPLIFICALIVSSPWSRHIFWIDPVNHTYHRGDLHALQMVFGFAFMLLASVLAFLRSRKAALTEKRKECRFLCFVVALSFAGGTLQTINYDLVFLWPFTAAAAFLIFVDFQGHRISVDSLTSLNNRGSLEIYMQRKSREHAMDWYVIMMDVDHFKHINDQFGHVEGDHALQIVAQALRQVFGASNAFISRYGGDEFVVVSEVLSLDEYMLRCRAELRRIGEENRLPYAIQLSFGYAKYDHIAPISFDRLIYEADRMMYRRKGERIPGRERQ